MKTQTSFVHLGGLISGWVGDWKKSKPKPWWSSGFVAKMVANNECFEERSEWLNPGHMTVGGYILLCRIQHMKLEGWGKFLHYTKSSTPKKDFLGQFRD